MQAIEYINSLDPVKYGCNFKNSIYNLDLLIGIFRSSHFITLRWLPQDLADIKST